MGHFEEKGSGDLKKSTHLPDEPKIFNITEE